MALIKVPTRGRVALADSDMPAGSVLQVVYKSNEGNTNTYIETTSSTYASIPNLL